MLLEHDKTGERKKEKTPSSTISLISLHSFNRGNKIEFDSLKQSIFSHVIRWRRGFRYSSVPAALETVSV